MGRIQAHPTGLPHTFGVITVSRLQALKRRQIHMIWRTLRFYLCVILNNNTWGFESWKVFRARSSMFNQITWYRWSLVKSPRWNEEQRNHQSTDNLLRGWQGELSASVDEVSSVQWFSHPWKFRSFTCYASGIVINCSPMLLDFAEETSGCWEEKKK